VRLVENKRSTAFETLDELSPEQSEWGYVPLKKYPKRRGICCLWISLLCHCPTLRPAYAGWLGNPVFFIN